MQSTVLCLVVETVPSSLRRSETEEPLQKKERNKEYKRREEVKVRLHFVHLLLFLTD